jgi:phenylacetate-CoA ligase
MNSDVITDNDRYPTLTENGRRMLQFLREHPNAPSFRNESGNRLNHDDIAKVREFEQEVSSVPLGWRPGESPWWMSDFVEQCFTEVPFYRRYGSLPRDFQDIPTISRADLSRDIAQFVPDSVPIDRLINFRTSGTSGHPLLLASHPVVAANYLAFHKRALRRFGIELSYGAPKVGVVLVGFQRKCFTYVSVTPTMNESGLVKINLHSSDWRNPDDRALYLDALAPEIYTGDPIAFGELKNLSLKTRPRALLSTSMTLLPAMREALETHFRCPVLDLYSMNETGPIAVADPSVGGHVLLQPKLFVEILDSVGQSMPPGQRGEITITGGFNFCLPLLRYRTGDFAAIQFNGTEVYLETLEGRPPVRFRTVQGEWLNNIEVTHSLQRLAIPQFTLHQKEDGQLLFRFTGPGHLEATITNVLLELFGSQQQITLEEVPSFEGKVVQYTSALPEAQS